ncbi:MAG: hypothetical protein FWF52_01785 [Candidatus Azobacteroides sp.]|nr:hypothetical protein [Candidatus Azobacteroides sp.]
MKSESMNYRGKICILLISALFLVSCNKTRRGNENSFCYWKTTFTFSSAEREMWKETGANHLYVRYFDVDWNYNEQMAMPVGTINYWDTLPCVHFTPCVFISNRVFEKSSRSDLDSLSVRIKKRILDVSQSVSEKSYSDILIDCDWTGKTSENFFYFLKQLKNDFHEKEITATLRLWQYKQRDIAGIPPVKRCLLMCYNMQTANDYTVENSIASLSELKKYVSGDKYPLKLDLALPIFNWAILFRNGRFIGLLGEVAKADFENNILDYESIGENRYQLITDKVIGNFFARKGDEIRVEMVTKNELENMIQYLKSEIDLDSDFRMTFFAWNESYIKNYGTDEIKNIYTSFSK